MTLLGWPFGALVVVLMQGKRGREAARPFSVAAAAAFVVAGILLVMALVAEPEFALSYLFYGTAAFGGAILSALSAMTLVRLAEAPRSPDDPW